MSTAVVPARSVDRGALVCALALAALTAAAWAGVLRAAAMPMHVPGRGPSCKSSMPSTLVQAPSAVRPTSEV